VYVCVSLFVDIADICGAIIVKNPWCAGCSTHCPVKKADTKLMTVTSSDLNQFSAVFFAVRFSRKFATKLLVKISPCLMRVATLPYETSMSENKRQTEWSSWTEGAPTVLVSLQPIKLWRCVQPVNVCRVCVLTRCRSVQFICCEQAFMFIPSHSVSCEAWCCFAVLSQFLYRLFNICSTLEALSKALVIICYVFLIPSHSTPWVKKTRHQTLGHNFTKY